MARRAGLDALHRDRVLVTVFVGQPSKREFARVHSARIIRLAGTSVTLPVWCSTTLHPPRSRGACLASPGSQRRSLRRSRRRPTRSSCRRRRSSLCARCRSKSGALSGRAALGQRVGEGDARVGRGTRAEPGPFVKASLCGDCDGFSLYTGVRVAAGDRRRLEVTALARCSAMADGWGEMTGATRMREAARPRRSDQEPHVGGWQPVRSGWPR